MTAVSNGVPVRRWTRLRPRNESLDCRVYAYAALKLLAPDLDVAARKMAAWEKPAPNFASLPLPGQRREPIGHRPPRPKL
jgi:phage terminase large subunit GpA-like protein